MLKAGCLAATLALTAWVSFRAGRSAVPKPAMGGKYYTLLLTLIVDGKLVVTQTFPDKHDGDMVASMDGHVYEVRLEEFK